MSSYQNTLTIGLFLFRCFPFFCLLSALLKTLLYFSSGEISTTSLISYINLFPYGNISAYSSYFIYVTGLSSFKIYISAVNIRDYASISLSISLLSDSSDIMKPSFESLSMYSSSEISHTNYSTSSSLGFSSSGCPYSSPFMLPKMVIPGANSNIPYWSKVGCFSIFASYSTLLTTSSYMVNYTKSSLWISIPGYIDMKNFPLYSFDSLKTTSGMLFILNLFVVPVFTMA